MDLDLDLERFDHEWKHGDRALAKELAIEWVDRHPQIAVTLDPYALEDIVRMIGRYYDIGNESDRIIADMYLLARRPPQHITGTLNMGSLTEQALQVAADAWAKP